jgi:hypothetical protein
MRIDRPIISTLAAFLFALTATRGAASSDWRTTLKARLGPRRTTLLRCILRGKRLARWGNLRTPEPFSTNWGLDRGTPVDRFYNDRFLEANRNLITGRVLEIQSPVYTRRYGVGVEHVDSIDIDERFQPTILCDLAEMDRQIPAASYDCFLLPYTMMFVRDLEPALRNALRVVKPGGTILATTSLLSPSLAEYPEYWRMTAAGWRALLERVWAGCDIQVAAYGNSVAAVASILGLAQEELTTQELERNDPRFPVVITILCRRPREAAA